MFGFNHIRVTRAIVCLAFVLFGVLTLLITTGVMTTHLHTFGRTPTGRLLYIYVFAYAPSIASLLGIGLLFNALFGAVPTLKKVNSLIAAALVMGFSLGLPAFLNIKTQRYVSSLENGDLAQTGLIGRRKAIALSGIRDSYECNALCENLLRAAPEATLTIMTDASSAWSGGSLSLDTSDISFALNRFQGEHCAQSNEFRKNAFARNQQIRLQNGQQMCIIRVDTPQNADLLLHRNYDISETPLPKAVAAARSTEIFLAQSSATVLAYRKTETRHRTLPVPASLMRTVSRSGQLTIDFGLRESRPSEKGFSDYITKKDIAELTKIILSFLS